MKPSSAGPPRKGVDRARARNAVLLNQLATPGLGSLTARRYVAGVGQLVLALAGFGMLVTWFVLVIIRLYQQIDLDSGSETATHGWLGLTGGALFALAWIWALFTSFSILRRAGDPEPNFADPPKI